MNLFKRMKLDSVVAKKPPVKRVAKKKKAAPAKLSKTEVKKNVLKEVSEEFSFWVNEGPSVLIRNSKVFISYSASATDENYAMGLLWTDENANLMDPQSWHKLKEPVLQSCFEHKVYGPGHNSFTVSADGKPDLLVYHARTYTEIVGDPLWDPNRHTYVKALRWDDQGMPLFGRPSLQE